MLLLQSLLWVSTPFRSLFSFDRESDPGEETAASLQGSILMHLMMYFLDIFFFAWEVCFEDRVAYSAPLAVSFQGDRYDTCIKGIIAPKNTRQPGLKPPLRR